jgi:hypothetical protein
MASGDQAKSTEQKRELSVGVLDSLSNFKKPACYSWYGRIYRWILTSKIAILMVASKTNNHEMAIDHFCTVPVDGSYTPHSSGKSLKKPH